MEKTADIKKIRKAMEKCQDEKRFTHTLGVAYTATALAMRYDADIKKAETAGLLHDCAKCMDNDKRISICKKPYQYNGSGETQSVSAARKSRKLYRHG